MKNAVHLGKVVLVERLCVEANWTVDRHFCRCCPCFRRRNSFPTCSPFFLRQDRLFALHTATAQSATLLLLTALLLLICCKTLHFLSHEGVCRKLLRTSLSGNTHHCVGATPNRWPVDSSPANCPWHCATVGRLRVDWACATVGHGTQRICATSGYLGA